MTINNIRKQKIPTITVIGALLFTMFGSVQNVSAAISAAPTGTSILTQNGGTVVTTFSPALGPTITASTTGATAYYGVRVVSATTSPDVFWEITVSHATSTLTLGMVGITEKGWFDATGHMVADSPYIPTVSGGDLVLTGNSGWSVTTGEDFTNVDGITFSGLAPLGTYTVTRVLMSTATSTASSTPLDAPYVFSVDLVAAAAPDTTAPVFATTTDIFATTSATSTIVSYTNPTATDNMDPSPSVVCTPASGSVFTLGTTTVTCTATDNASNTATTTFNVIVTFSTSTSTATTTPPTSSGGGSGSASGRRNITNDTTTGSVLGGSVENTGTTFVSPLNPFQQVLGASAFIPGIPNAGAGGDAARNIALLLGSVTLAALGLAIARKRGSHTS